MKYSEKKAAQVAAFFISSAGGRVEILKLMKLMYLAERESFTRYGEPLTGDKLFSMEHGPILSSTLDHMNNFIDSEPGGWDSWISDREDHYLALKNNEDPIPNLTQLSDADLEVVRNVWEDFGWMTGSQLRQYTHDRCAEWEDPNQSSSLIPYSRLLKCVGFDADVAIELNQRLLNQRNLEMTFDHAVG